MSRTSSAASDLPSEPAPPFRDGSPGSPSVAEPVLVARQRTILRDLARLGSQRTITGPEMERLFRSQIDAANLEFEEGYQTVIVRFASSKESADHEYRERLETIGTRFEEEQVAADQEAARSRRRALGRYEKEKTETKQTFKETSWTLAAVLEGAKTEAEHEYQEWQQRVANLMQQLRQLHGEAVALLERWDQHPEEAESNLATDSQHFRKLPECIAIAEEHLELLRRLTLPRFAKGQRLTWLFVLLGLALLYPTYLLDWYGPAISSLAVAVLGVIVTLLVKSRARNEVARLYEPLSLAVADSEASRERILAHYEAKRQQLLLANKNKHAADLRRAYKKYRRRRAICKHRRANSLRKMREEFARRRGENERRRADDLHQTEETYQRVLAAVQGRYETDTKKIHARHDQQLATIKATYERDRQQLVLGWEQGLARAQESLQEIIAESQRLFPGWEDPSWATWPPPQEVPPVLRFGEYRVSISQLAAGVAGPEGGPVDLLTDRTLPALCAFPEQGSLLFEAYEAGRAIAVQALQALMYRLLTAIPPGKVRFTIVDPVGLGQNFAAFMHLADYEEALVGSRIWTEQSHIEHRLADLTAHMENVIQKYLRNQFQTIEEYNAQAGEVAEPFRVLVVANFPANFSAEAARRLVSVAQSGRRCGVHTLITVDLKQPMPPGFQLGDLEHAGAVLVWQDSRFVWKDRDFGRFPLQLDEPPPAEFSTRILQLVGEKARAASRVEVPFEFIAPPPEQWWTGDTRYGVSVPLGRAGATKRQHLKLGQGTSQHVLVAGKTGSGKSTLLHALITNLALTYSPDEAELYLIDFKKGVEFKTYAANELPHARVIAIESEREFGLSVLQRLDAELKQRGDRFRDAGAQDLASYRQETRQTLPRILLIVDEFQEFFVEDDRISQEAAQLLDRLVRQGRAFGLHVLLGSQTLGGAYTLARSTIDQMAVRIALQCSEADAHLILSDENSAARLLSRPGEAIYNDANGLVEGNNPFQVVWLADERREQYLGQIRDLHRQRPPAATVPTLVFEGNIPANPRKNHLLEQLLHAPSWSAPPRALHAWLGEPMTIKDPTVATFRPQSASNMLVVGQADEAALAVLTTSLVSLATQLPPTATPCFHVVDGSPVDAAYAGYLAKLADVLPHPLRLGGWRDLPTVINELAVELERRQKTTDTQFAPLFLFLFGLQRFRDLRRSEDDFGFGRREEKPSPSQQFATLLREGAGLGMHVVLWCDNLNNLNRSIDRQGLREFDLRILFQMSVADSSNLIDTPMASKLGVHRAYFYSEEQGRLEKFRPYGLPTEEWLAQVREQLRAGHSTPAVRARSLSDGNTNPGADASGSD